MKYLPQIITTATMAFGVSTSLGVFLHDTNIDKAVVSAWRIMSDFSGVLKDGQTNPRTTPRSTDRKHLHTKLVSRGGDGDIDGHRLMVDPVSVS